MILPKIAIPNFDVEVPSLKQTISMRPFAVREEKVLLIAMESKSRIDMINAVRNVVEACIVTENIDASKFSLFDIEYLFIILRANSVNDKIEGIKLPNETCSEEGCPKTMEVEIDLKKTEIVRSEKHTRDIRFTDNVGVVMRYLPAKRMLEITGDDKIPGQEKSFTVITESIEKIYDKDNVYSASEVSKEELKEWVESLPHEYFSLLSEFFLTTPKIRNMIHWECPNCKKTADIPIEGFESFFV